ncbi:MAG TPA: molybdopterin dinucleotide binding domain-containing protein, partial [Gemmatimonadales bacterium]
VPVERIVTLAKSFAERKPAVAVCGADVMQGPDGLLHGLAVHSLNILTGSVNRAGGVLFGNSPPLEPLVDPALDAPARAGLAAAPIGSAVPIGAGDPARRFAEAVAGAAASPVEALFLYYANPLASSTHPETWSTALSRIPFIVSFSPFLDESARQADLVLPDRLPYERWQDAPAPSSYGYPVWGLARPLVQPKGSGLATGDAVLGIAERLGGSVAQSLPYSDFEALLKARARGLFAARRGMAYGDEFERTHYRQMEERGWWLAEDTDFDGFWEELATRGGWTDLFYDDTDPARLARTASGRIELLPAWLQETLAAEGRERHPYVLPAVPIAEPSGEYPLRLIPYRVSTLASGTVALERWLAEQPTVLPGRYWVPWVEIHPTSAAALGLRDNASVWVTSARGRYRARLKLFPGAAPETVCAPYGIRHPDGELANPLQLLDGSTDPLTGLACWSTTFVRLEPGPATVP